MSGGISRTFGVTFLASPLGEGERTEVRGSKRATRNCPENPHLTLPLSLRPLLCPHWRWRVRLSQGERAKGEATFQCPARVCVARTPLKEMQPVALALTSKERYFLTFQ